MSLPTVFWPSVSGLGAAGPERWGEVPRDTQQHLACRLSSEPAHTISQGCGAGVGPSMAEGVVVVTNPP